jgi:hypothetical protein
MHVNECQKDKIKGERKRKNQWHCKMSLSMHKKNMSSKFGENLHVGL